MAFQLGLRTIYVDALRQDMLSRSDADTISSERSFIEVALDYLGYDDDIDFRYDAVSDGSGDFGLDASFVSDEAATLFQFKSIEYVEALDDQYKMPPGSLADLRRIHSLISVPETVPQEANAKVRAFLQKFRSAINSARTRHVEA
jgi:hypothetical protein